MNRFLLILKWLGIAFLSLLILLFILLLLDQDAREIPLTGVQLKSIESQKFIDSVKAAANFEELHKMYGRNKHLAPGFELPCLLALSFYPELQDTRIDFLLEPVFLPLASRPQPLSVLFPWIKRKYLVVISTSSTDFFEPILLKNTPFNEQVGIIGHELAHSVFYQDKNSFELLKIAYCYQNDNDYRIQFERDTDKRAIAHGLGYQLYDFAFFVRKAFGDTQQEIMSEEGGMYLSPAEIVGEMQQYDFYLDPLNPSGSYFAD